MTTHFSNTAQTEVSKRNVPQRQRNHGEREREKDHAAVYIPTCTLTGVTDTSYYYASVICTVINKLT